MLCVYVIYWYPEVEAKWINIRLKSFGPLFPAADYTLIQSFVTSTAASIAISSATIFLIFPETLNHVALKAIKGLLVTIRQLLEIQEDVLKTETPEELREASSLGSKIQGMLAGVFAGMDKRRCHILSLIYSHNT